MHILKKCLLGLALLLTLSGSTVPVSAAANAAADLKAVYETADTIMSQAFTMNAQANSPMGQLDLVMQGRTITKPALLLQADMDIEMGGLLGQKISMKTPLYMEETDKAFVIYYQMNGTWEKQTLKKDTGDKAWKSLSPEESMAMVRSVNLVKETPTQKVLQVVFDGKKIAELSRKFMAASTAAKGSAMAQKQMEKLLDSVGDLEFTMTVDKATNYTVKDEADLTPAARRIAHGVMENIPKLKTAEKQQMVNMIDHTTLHMTTTSSDFNAVKEIVIPAEARAAKEAPAANSKKTKTAANV